MKEAYYKNKEMNSLNITKERLSKFENLTSDLYMFYGQDEELDVYIDKITSEVSDLMVDIENLIPKDNPICSHCQTEMKPVTYKGYYEEFNYWHCECNESDIFKKNTWHGSFR